MTEQERDPAIPEAPGLTEAERGFVHRVAQHYHDTDNMAWGYGYTIGWLMISDPPEQRVSEITRRLGIDREAVDHVVRLLVTPGVLEKRGPEEDYTLVLPDANWPKAVRYSLVNIPKFHAVLHRGLEVLDGASEERRLRLLEIEHLYRHLATEVPAIFDRYESADAH